MQLRRLILATAVAAAFAPAAALAQPNPYAALLTPVLSGGTTVLGQPIAYPTGTVNITTAIVTLPPGGQTGWHIHQIPLFAYFLEGELTVDYGSKGTRTYVAGEGVFEAIDWPHNGTNTGTVPVKLLAVYLGAEGTATASPATGPQ